MKTTGMFLAAFVLLLCGGCGYQIGSLAHPQLKTVAVAPVINETLQYNAAAQLRNMLCERIVTDGSMKLVDMSEADCIVYAKVTSVTIKESAWSGITRSNSNDEKYQPNQWDATASVTYSVILPGRAAPLIKNASASGSSSFLSGPDIESARMNGIRQALYEAAKGVVSGLTEGW